MVSKVRKAAGCGCLVMIGLFVLAAFSGGRQQMQMAQQQRPVSHERGAVSAPVVVPKADTIPASDEVAEKNQKKVPSSPVTMRDPTEKENPKLKRKVWVITVLFLRDNIYNELMNQSGLGELRKEIDKMPEGEARDIMVNAFNEQLTTTQVIAKAAAQNAVNQKLRSEGHAAEDFDQLEQEFAAMKVDEDRELAEKRREADERAAVWTKYQSTPSAEEIKEDRGSQAKGKLALARQYIKLKRPEKAKPLLEVVVKEFADTEAGKDAATELERLR